ncbi:Pentatricopeptide repeat-containing protein [Hirschfeldia incana]|nr:Pentatricopeptide repeat-containing protein [Hirschfeldia incana]
MFAQVLFRRTRLLLARSFHVAKKFSNPPEPEDILFTALCLNLKQRRWNTLHQLSSTLTTPLVSRVLLQFRTSPKLALEFHNWFLGNNPNPFEASCVMVHLLVESRRYDDALSIMVKLMSAEGGVKLSPLDVLSGLVRSYEACGSSPDVFDSLVRACTQSGDAQGAWEVIEKARAEGFRVSVHALNNFMGCLLNLNEIDWFWEVYKEMDALGYVENVNTFNLVIYSFCKECKLLEALSVFYRMLKCGVWPNVVSFNMMIDGACKMGDMVFALELLGKMRVMSGGSVSPNAVTYNSVVNGFCKAGRLDLAERVRGEMVKSGVGCNERTYGALVDAYGRGGRSDEALRLCDEMTSKGLVANTVVCNSVVYWLFMEGDVEGAMLVLSDMISKEMEIDRFTHAIVIRGLCRNGYVEEAVKFQRGITGDVVCYNTLMHHFVTEK